MLREQLYISFSSFGSRPVNEDSAAVFENSMGKCYVLCDGLGGHGMGDAASQLVVEKIGEQFADCDNISEFIPAAIEYAQQQLLAQQEMLHAQMKMKTTVVIVATDDKNAYIGHVGDSRAYVFSKNKVRSRTLDHSIPQMLVLTKEIKESEIRHHPDRSLLLRVMGTEWDESKYEIEKPVALKKCQAFLLCSDGFWELIDEQQMCQTLKSSKTVQEWMEAMTQIIESNGKGTDMDNYTAIAVFNS